MKMIRVAAAALNQTPLAWDANQQNIVRAIEMAREQKVHVLCLPELCLTGYGCEDAFHSSGLFHMARDVLMETIPQTRGMVVSLGLPLLVAGGFHNAVALAVDGKLAGFVAKRNLAGTGIHYEPRWFKPWTAGERKTVNIDGTDYPVGDQLFDCGGVRIGFEICEDAWVADRPGMELSAADADLILNPSASHFAFGKQTVRERFVLEGSRVFGVGYVYANLLGNEAGRVIYDGVTMIASEGDMLAVGRRFSMADVQLTTAQLDVESVRMRRARNRSFSAEQKSTDIHSVSVPFQLAPTIPDKTATAPPEWEKGQAIKAEEFTRAVALGLFDYLRKSYSRGYIVSLSGGADSSAVAVLSAMAIRFAVEENGLEQTLEKLDYIPGIGKLQSAQALVGRLLSCVYQSTKNSSDTTRDAARAVAQAIGAEFVALDVDPLVEGYQSMVAGAIGRELTWEEDDLALQNIQARVRSPGVWMMANIKGALLLSTSNRSEAAVGYATMDGDTSGGLCPIAGIDKAYLRQWLVWMEKEGPSGFGPVPALAEVNRQAPTAELRPSEANQTDEDDLMPYEILDMIERDAIRDKHTPLEIYQLLLSRNLPYEELQLAQWVERFFNLWCRNQWKRERYAPSFHLDDENLDPKTWCRFPILSGGFRRELRAMWQWIEENK